MKTHVGHLETASFMAGLIKCLLMLQHETLIPNQGVGGEGLNPAIGWGEWGMEVVRKVQQFDRRGKVMMISSFGFGGSNGAAVIEAFDERREGEEWRKEEVIGEVTKGVGKGEKMNGVNGRHHAYTNGHSTPSPPTPPALPSPPYLFLLSAQTPAALEARISAFNALISDPSTPPLHPYTVSYTLATRVHHRHLSYCVASSLPTQGLQFSPAKRKESSPPPLVWCFAGQGPQHPLMGRTLYATQAVFKAAIDEMDGIYQ